MATGQQKVLLSVVGNLDDPGFHQCRLLAEAIADEFSPVSLDVRALVHTDYEDFVLAKSKELGAAGNYAFWIVFLIILILNNIILLRMEVCLRVYFCLLSVDI